jgi:inhibitor of cysteine peptidase
MRRLSATLLVLLVVFGFMGGIETAASQIKEETGAAPARVGPESAAQTSEPIEQGRENPVTNETVSGNADVTDRLDVGVNEEFHITLASNATTGYHWELAEPPNNAVVRLVTSEYRPPKTNLVGAGGHEIWTFRAVSPGQTVIRLKYVRPWEKDVPPVKTVSYIISVR